MVSGLPVPAAHPEAAVVPGRAGAEATGPGRATSMERTAVVTPRDQGIAEQCDHRTGPMQVIDASRLGDPGGALTGGSSQFSLQLHAEKTSIEHDAVGVGLPSGRARPRAETMGEAGIRSRLASQEARREHNPGQGHDDRRPQH